MQLMRNPKRLLLLGASSLGILSLLIGAFAIRFGSAGAATPSYQINGNTPGFIKHATDQGALDPSTIITVTAWLKLHNTSQLDQLVTGQQQTGNANFHKWLNQSQFNATYGATPQELNSVENFLTAHNLTVLATSDDNSYVKVQGAVGDVEKAFHTQIDNYSFQGQTYYSNTADPNVNDSSGAHIDAITGLDNYGFQPDIAYPTNGESQGANWAPLASGSNGFFFSAQCFLPGTVSETFKSNKPKVTATYTGARYGQPISNSNLGTLAPCGYQPSEMQTAYNMTPLYNAGLDGTGQTVVITDAFGSPTIQGDANVFSGLYSLPALDGSNFQVYQAPGPVVNNPCNKKFCAGSWPDEITLDVEWVHSMAPGAHIALVIAPNNGNDLDEAVNYAVVHHLGNTISNSWGSFEGFGNPARFNRDNRILEEAAAQGIDVNFSSGDDGDFTDVLPIKTVSFPASSPFATSIGGTSLSLDSNNNIAFQTGWGDNLTRVADKVSLGSPPVDPPLSLGFQFGAGGGTSLTFAKPAFQNSLPGTMRQLPDVSLLADPQTGVEIIETINGQLSVTGIGGTSLACPMFSAIMAIASEKAGHGLGQAAPLMYGLSSSNGTSTAIYDVQPFTGPANVTGSITDASGTTNYSADQLAAPLGNTTQYYSALYNSPFSTRWFVIAFGTDSSLTTASGWDNVTGVGTPNGANFVNAVGA